MGWKKKGRASGIGGHLHPHMTCGYSLHTPTGPHMVHRIETEDTNTQMFLQPLQQGPNLLPKLL